MTETATYPVDLIISCMHIYPYPREESRIPFSELEVVGLRFSRDQALKLAAALREATPGWEGIHIIGCRFEQRDTDDTPLITVDSIIPIKIGG